MKSRLLVVFPTMAVVCFAMVLIVGCTPSQEAQVMVHYRDGSKFEEICLISDTIYKITSFDEDGKIEDLSPVGDLLQPNEKVWTEVSLFKKKIDDFYLCRYLFPDRDIVLDYYLYMIYTIDQSLLPSGGQASDHMQIAQHGGDRQISYNDLNAVFDKVIPSYMLWHFLYSNPVKDITISIKKERMEALSISSEDGDMKISFSYNGYHIHRAKTMITYTEENMKECHEDLWIWSDEEAVPQGKTELSHE